MDGSFGAGPRIGVQHLLHDMSATQCPTFGCCPPVVNCVQDLIDLVDEVDIDSVKIGLDLPLFDHQESEYITKTVNTIGKKMIHSHTLGVKVKSLLP